MTQEPRDPDPQVDALLAAWSRATARPAPEFSVPARSSRFTPVRLGVVLLAIVLAAAAVAAVGTLPNTAPNPSASPDHSTSPADGTSPVAACADGGWPATPVSCDAADRSFQPGRVQIDGRRIWLTTLGAVRDAVRPARQMDTYPPDATPVWVFMYDGSRNRIQYPGPGGEPMAIAGTTRWIHVADATDPGTIAGRFLYDYGWAELGNPPVPESLPRPALPALAKLDPDPPSSVLATAIDNLANAPAVRWDLTAGYRTDDYQVIAVHSTGTIDFDHGRVGADADGGRVDWSMFFFGGPTSGSIVIADGLFVRDQSGVWERIPDGKVPTDWVFNAGGRAHALRNALARATIGSALRAAPCGTTTCQVVLVTLPASAMSEFRATLTGKGSFDPMPPRVSDVTGELFIDPSTSYLRRVDATFTAGNTTWLITLSLDTLPQAPEIVAPIP